MTNFAGISRLIKAIRANYQCTYLPFLVRVLEHFFINFTKCLLFSVSFDMLQSFKNIDTALFFLTSI